MKSKGNIRNLQVITEVLEREDGLTASQIKDRMHGHRLLHPWGAPHVQVVAQLLRGNQFKVVGTLSNHTKKYSLCRKEASQ